MARVMLERMNSYVEELERRGWKLAAAVLTGGLSALAVGVLTSVPQLEGFAVNGELLGSAVGAAALAVTLRAAWTRDEPDPRLLTIAGVLAAGAISVKQSGFDAPLGAIAYLAGRATLERDDGLGLGHDVDVLGSVLITAAAMIFFWFPVSVVCRSSISNMAFPRGALVCFGTDRSARTGRP